MPSRPEGEEVFVSSEPRDASGIGVLLRSSRLQNNDGKPALFHIQTKSPAAPGFKTFILLGSTDYCVLTQPDLAFDHSYW